MSRIHAMLERLGLLGPGLIAPFAERPPVWSFRKGPATVYVTEGADTVIVSSKVRAASRADDVALQRRLLQANLFMDGAFFAVEEGGAVFLYQIVALDGLDDEVLAAVVANVAAHAASGKEEP